MMKKNRRYSYLAFSITLVYMSPRVMAVGEMPDRSEFEGSGATEVQGVVVEGKYHRHQAGHDRVYEEDMSSIYRDKDQIDLFRGTSSADLFRGMVGVGVGDARNSGGIDPNVRGIQGQGRVPVTIDGAENGVTVWRGYYGANNRSYIDPMLISSIRVEKGSSFSRDVETGTGGGVAVKTLEVDDILKPGKKAGIDIRMEAGNNMVRERRGNLEKVGSMMSTDHLEELQTSQHILPDKSKRETDTFGKDQAFRIAAAAKTDRTEWLAAYAYRYHGNYYAGKGGRKRYERIYSGEMLSIPVLGDTQDPENVFNERGEVLNTSLDNRSFLFKAGFKPTENQMIKAGYRSLDSRYGEIMPARVYGLETKEGHTLPQWPLSRVKMGVYTLDYHWKPKNRWLDFQAGIWANRAKMELQNSGAEVLELGQTNQEIYNEIATGKAFPVFHGSINKVSNNRWGVHLSNTMRLHHTLKLTLGGNYQHEKLAPTDDSWEDLVGKNIWAGAPRKGQRREYKFHFNFDWQPTDRLAISAGARYNNYHVRDDRAIETLSSVGSLRHLYEESLRHDQLNRIITDPGLLEKYNIGTSPQLTIPLADYNAATSALAGEESATIPYEYIDQDMKRWLMEGGMSEAEADDLARSRGSYKMPRDEYGKISRADNPFLNGEAAKKGWVIPKEFENQEFAANVENVAEMDGMLDQYREMANELYSIESGFADNYYLPEEIPAKQQRAAELREKMSALENAGWKRKMANRRGHAWSPTFSLSYRIGDNGRIYGRWARTTRMPSIFEDLSGASASRPSYKMKPETGTNLELGYVHNLSGILPGNPDKADVKLVWYRNDIRNFIDRGYGMVFIQRDRWTTSGLELSARYDNGRFFAEAGANYLLSNRVCDTAQAAQTDIYYGSSPECIDGGFPGGYMYNMELPRYSFNLVLGGRFFNQKLEAGSRLSFHTGYKRSAEAQEYLRKYDYNNTSTSVMNGSIPWHAAAVVDAYVKYNFKNDLSVEFSGSNLTNRYYFDPLTRAKMPAPGRTFRFALSKKF